MSAMEELRGALLTQYRVDLAYELVPYSESALCNSSTILIEPYEHCDCL